MPNNTFLNRLLITFKQDSLIYITYAITFTVISIIFISAGVFDKAKFALYTSEFYTMAITTFALISVGYLMLLMLQRNKRPMRAFAEKFKSLLKKPEAFLSFIVLFSATSIMLSAFTSMKSFIPFFQPFIYDQYFADIDRALHFGIDPWVITHTIFSSPIASSIINFIYTLWFIFYWTFLLLFILEIRSTHERLQYLISHTLCWFILGGLLATALSSAGPLFYHHFVDGANPFADLMTRLADQNEWLSKNSSFFEIWALDARDILWAHNAGDPILGNGISAMPSMHISIAVLMALAMGRIHKYLGLIFWAFALMILIGSVHLAWHYAIDGYVSGVLTIIIWKTVGIFLPNDKIRTTSK